MTDEKSGEDLSNTGEYPEELQAVYSMLTINDPILLYEGSLDIEQCERKICGTGSLRFRWLPVPAPRFQLDNRASQNDLNLGNALLSVHGAIKASKALVDNSQLHLSGTNISWEASGWFSTLETGNGAELTSVLFHIPDFVDFLGSPIRERGNQNIRRARAVFEAGGWHIVLDALSTTNSKFLAELKGNGGYAITHVGRFERTNGESFNAEAAREFLGLLCYFLSFCRGMWIPPILPVGFDSKGTRVWEEWRDWKIDRFLSVSRWINEASTECFSASFPGFLYRSTDELWGEPIRLSLWWYMECNKQAGGLEGSMILAQSAFELLAWTLLVEDLRALSEDGFEKLPASDKLRLLLSQCKIPLIIPAQLIEFQKLAKEHSWADGPHAITEMRNSLVHPKPKKRRRVLDAEPIAIFEAWNLANWYLELVLLWLFEYKGSYTNRLKRGCSREEAVELVPWRDGSST